MTNYFYVTIDLAKVKRVDVATECFCVATQFGLEWSFYFMTEYSYVATEFGLEMGF